jgi:hypothetical protein
LIKAREYGIIGLPRTSAGLSPVQGLCVMQKSGS